MGETEVEFMLVKEVHEVVAVQWLVVSQLKIKQYMSKGLISIYI